MANRYNQGSHFAGATRFVSAPMSEVEFSKMNSPCRVITDMNAGDIVPVLCLETLPHSTFSIDFNYVNRLLSAAYVPTMGELIFDVFAFHVPNRVVNDSWKNVLGENTSGFWSAPEVDLAPLTKITSGTLQIPVGSVADYYDLPTQRPIPYAVLSQMSDLVFKGYVCCFNEYFRDQNYQNPIICSKLNIYQGFDLSVGSTVVNQVKSSRPDGSYPSGAVAQAVLGQSSKTGVLLNITGQGEQFAYKSSFSMLDKPLKANKLHDVFTSVLPSPQKGDSIEFSVSGQIPVDLHGTRVGETYADFSGTGLHGITDFPGQAGVQFLGMEKEGDNGEVLLQGFNDTNEILLNDSLRSQLEYLNISGTVDLADSIGVTVDELRSAIATQQVLELLARGGSRYWSFLKSFFGVQVDDPFPDIPTQIGHYRSNLDMYQVAQTSQSTEESQQGALAAYGYTTSGSALFTKTFIEHGFIHIFAVVRHKSVYPTYVPPHWFKRKTFDFYLPQFANISEQPIRLATLNPFRADSLELALGFQECFWDYRFIPDRCRGVFRSGAKPSTDPSLGYDSAPFDIWHYGNMYDADFTVVNGDWLVSDTQAILDRTLRVSSELSPQFVCQFDFMITKQLPMPVYSVPGLDTI